jgi:hypothetical protein
MTDIHPAVELLAARMESHPEEFGPHGQGRWGTWLKQMEPLLTEEEKLMLRGPEMQGIHEDIMDELLNGPERRAEAERVAAIQQRARIQLEAGLAQKLNDAFPAQLQQGALRGHPAPWQNTNSALPSSISIPPTIKIGDETLDEGLLKSIKKALKL